MSLVVFAFLLPLLSVADNTAIPSMPDWLNPGSTGPGSQIPNTPTCMRISAEGQCGWSWKNVQDCTVYRCNHHIIGICSSHGYQIDRNCVCKGLSTSICSAACATPVYNGEYLNWLYATCIGYSVGTIQARPPSTLFPSAAQHPTTIPRELILRNRTTLKLRMQSRVVLTGRIHAKRAMPLLGPTAL